MKTLEHQIKLAEKLLKLFLLQGKTKKVIEFAWYLNKLKKV